MNTMLLDTVLSDVIFLLFSVLVLTLLIAAILGIVGVVILIARQWWKELRDA